MDSSRPPSLLHTLPARPLHPQGQNEPPYHLGATDRFTVLMKHNSPSPSLTPLSRPSFSPPPDSSDPPWPQIPPPPTTTPPPLPRTPMKHQGISITSSVEQVPRKRSRQIYTSHLLEDKGRETVKHRSMLVETDESRIAKNGNIPFVEMNTGVHKPPLGLDNGLRVFLDSSVTDSPGEDATNIFAETQTTDTFSLTTSNKAASFPSEPLALRLFASQSPRFCQRVNLEEAINLLTKTNDQQAMVPFASLTRPQKHKLLECRERLFAANELLWRQRLEGEASSLIKHTDNGANDMARANLETSSSEQENTSLILRIEGLELEVGLIKQKYTKARSAIGSYRKKLEDLKDKHTREVGTLQAEVQILSDEKQSLLDTKNTLDNDNRRLKGKSELMEAELLEVQQEREKFESEVQRTAQIMIQYTNGNIALGEVESFTGSSEIDRMYDDLVPLTKIFTSNSSLILPSITWTPPTGFEALSLEQKRLAMRRNYERGHKQNKAAAIVLLNSHLKDRDAIIDKMRSRLKQFSETNNSNITSERDSFRDKYHQILNEKAELVSQIFPHKSSDSEDETSQLTSKIQLLEEKNSRIAGELEDAKQLRKSANVSMEEWRKIAQHRQYSRDNLLKRVAVLEKTVAEKEVNSSTQCKANKAEVDEKTAVIKKLEEQVKGLEARTSSFTKTHEIEKRTFTDQLEMLKEDSTSASRLNKDCAEEIELLKSKLTDAHKCLIAVTEESEKAIESLEREKTKLEQEKAETVIRGQAAESHNMKKQATLNSLQGSHHALLDKKMSLEYRMKSIQCQLEDANATILTLKTTSSHTATESTFSIKQLADLENRVTNLQLLIMQKDGELEKNKDILKFRAERISNMERTIRDKENQLKAEHSRVKKTMEKWKLEREHVNEKQMEHKEIIKAKCEALSNAEERISRSVRERIGKENKDLRRRLDMSQGALKAMQDNYQSIQDMIASIGGSSEVDNLKAEKEKVQTLLDDTDRHRKRLHECLTKLYRIHVDSSRDLGLACARPESDSRFLELQGRWDHMKMVFNDFYGFEKMS
ncbi:uncharacterized protein IL334_000266 [Kwoniella shivajii]|uniref:Uncharacterized protein n=1 Tax=Kwoniella shivajii TaxID=564305 RepID=A0ABZ1CNZ9_9TREE|nr:hypothetical protein IL334_000266 [Kwoniella shivajii]